MIAQAEHIPVHLGAMPDAVAAVMAPSLGPGEIVILNDPFTGGTHLPDITLVSRTALGFAVSRAHHADVGGMEPASLPAFSRELYQEGVVIPPMRLDDDLLDASSRKMREPRRAPRRPPRPDRRAPARERRIEELCARRGRERVLRAMDELYAYSERVVRAAIAQLPDGRYEADDVLEPVEGELTIHATVDDRRRRDPDRLRRHVAAARRQPQLPARGHALGLLLRRPLPHRSGPPGFRRRLRAGHRHARPRAPSSTRGRRLRSSPATPRPRAASSTSLFRAFGQAVDVPAQGQGTMNNVTLGNDRFTYYETIGGGQGACPDADGPSGVHVAMSNTLNTPVEALELAVSRCASSATGCCARSGGGGDTRAATASSARCACSRTAGSRSSPSGGDTRRRARKAARPAAEAATWSTGRRPRLRRPATCARAPSSRSRPRAAAAEEGRLFRMGEVVAIYIGPNASCRNRWSG